MLRAIAIEQMTNQAPIQIRRAKHPIRDGKGQVHIHFHHEA